MMTGEFGYVINTSKASLYLQIFFLLSKIISLGQYPRSKKNLKALG